MCYGECSFCCSVKYFMIGLVLSLMAGMRCGEAKCITLFSSVLRLLLKCICRGGDEEALVCSFLCFWGEGIVGEEEEEE